MIRIWTASRKEKHLYTGLLEFASHLLCDCPAGSALSRTDEHLLTVGVCGGLS